MEVDQNIFGLNRRLERNPINLYHSRRP
jgi:hypothetical protein